MDRFLDAMTTQNKFPFSTPELRAELKHTFWLLNRVDSARALAKKLQAHPVFRDYEVILAAGDGKLDDTDENQKSFDRVKAAIAYHEKTITLSVGQLTTGVTIPEWSAVLMLSNLKSPALYMQAAFRAQNPCLFHENGTFRRKENAYVFDFDPARTLLIYERFANDLSQDTASGKGDTEERKAHIQNLLNFFPVIGEDEEGEMIPLDAEKVLSIPRKIKSKEVVRMGFQSNFLFQNISNVFSAPQEKLTRHNGRAGAHGTYNPKHNDRSFNLANSEHIDPERAKGNIYWDCFHGFRSALTPLDPNNLAATFSDVERQFYESRYTAFIESQNERNAKIRHTERNHSIPDLLSSRKTCPEETIYQLGTLDEHASAEDLLNIVTEFIEEFKAKFGEHVHVLDWALHLDESTPHIHERHVFDCENKYGEVAPQQEKALEALGFELPNPGKPLSRRNNRKITFDAACRKMLFEIAKRHGLNLEEEAEYGNRKYLEKQDFILAKQKEQLFAQQNRLDELTLKVNDMETLLDDVSAAAYDKAVEVVTDVVRTETRKEDMRMIEDTKKWVLSPKRKAPKATREYTAKHLDTVLDKFLKTMQTTATRLQEKLLKPDVRQKGKEQVKEKARDSVLQLLSRLQAEQTQRKPGALHLAEKSKNLFQ